MLRTLLISFSILAVTILIGCSDKKDEAAKLEEDFLNRQNPVDTTVPVDTETVEDTMHRQGLGDAGAVPKEETDFDFPSAPAGGAYTVQVASCESPDYATYLVNKYTERGYQPYVTVAEVGGQTFYRVRIGAFDTQAEAKSLQAELLDRFSVTTWIDER